MRTLRWACPSVPDACPQCTHQFLTRMLRVRICSWFVCSGYASVPDPYAQGTHQFLIRINTWRICLVYAPVPDLYSAHVSVPDAHAQLTWDSWGSYWSGWPRPSFIGELLNSYALEEQINNTKENNVRTVNLYRDCLVISLPLRFLGPQPRSMAGYGYAMDPQVTQPQPFFRNYQNRLLLNRNLCLPNIEVLYRRFHLICDL